MLIGQPLFNGEFGAREAIRNALAGLAVAVQQVALRLAALDVRGNCIRNVTAIVSNVDHILPALAPELPRPDVDGGNAEIGALANSDAGVADDRRRAAQQSQEVFGEHVAK